MAVLGGFRLSERAYPAAPAGWTDGEFRFREPVEAPAAAASLPAMFRFRSFSEESEALEGNANTIARRVYREGTVLAAALPARTHRVSLRLQAGSDETACTLLVLVNGAPCARVRVPAGGDAAATFDVELDRRSLELSFAVDGEPGAAADAGWRSVCLASLDITELPRAARERPEVFLVADSTVQTYFDEERPQSGWGEWLAWYLHTDHVSTRSDEPGCGTPQAVVFRGEGPVVHNRALGGRAALSYRAEGRLYTVLRDIRPGDCALIQFGINDSTPERPMRYASVPDFTALLGEYLDAFADRGARAVLVTPIPQLLPADADNPIDAYADAVRALAAARQVPLIDLRALAAAYLAGLGDNIEAAYLRAPAFQYASHPDGIADTIHLSTMGARKLAGIVAEGLCRIEPSFTCCPEDPVGPVSLRVRELSARVCRVPVGMVVDLDWEACPGADYWSVEKLGPDGRRYARSLTVKPSFRDAPLPAQAEAITYRVTAWRDADPSPASEVSVRIPATDGPLFS